MIVSLIKIKNIEHLFDKFSQTSSQKAIEKALSKKTCTLIKGVVGSGLNFRLVTAFHKLDLNFLLVMDNAEQAAYSFNDLEQLLNITQVFYFPASFNEAYRSEATNNANVLQRSEILKKLGNSKEKKIIVTYPEALFEKVISQKILKKKQERFK